MENWKTTIGGILLAIGTAGISVPIPEKYKWIPGALAALGGALLGLTAKDFNNHSTLNEVEKATEEKIK